MEWIELKEKHPEETGIYLVVNASIPAYRFLATWYRDGFKAENCCGNMPYHHAVITHWMPVPIAPEIKITRLLPTHIPNDLLDYVKEEVGQAVTKESILEAFSTLDNKQKRVIEMRFGFFGEKQTLKKVAKYFSVTIERIRQIENKALRVMFCYLKGLAKEEEVEQS